MARSKRDITYVRGAAILIAALSLPILACRTSAGTIGELLEQNCPQAYALDDRQHRAHDLADDNQYALAKRAAELYYDCSHDLNEPYARDWTRFSYLLMLSVSVPADDESRLLSVLSIVSDGANELAASTSFPDVRKKALWLRDNVRAELRGPPQ